METTIVQAAKEPILSLLFGTVFVCLMTLPYFYGLGRALYSQKDNPEASLLKFLALPFLTHLIATMGAVMFSNVWDLLYTDLQSTKLIQIFWSADPSGATNLWVKAAYSSADLMSLILYHLIIAIPFINLVAVYILSDRILKFSQQDAMSGFKSGAIKLVATGFVAALLTLFYQVTLDKTMFNGNSLNFKEWGTASSSVQMHANFYKRIARMGISGNVSIGSRGSGSSSISSSSSSSDSNLDAYFNNNK